MLYNDKTPKIEVDPETYEVKVDGKIATVDPAEKLSLARLYCLYQAPAIKRLLRKVRLNNIKPAAVVNAPNKIFTKFASP